MKQETQIGNSPLKTARLAYGCWRIGGSTGPEHLTPEIEANAHKAVIAAYEAGYNLFDHADIYCRGHAERIFGEILKKVAGMRDRVIIATKCGVRYAGEPHKTSPQRWDFSAEHIEQSCEGSLKRMGIETIDLYQLHRPDYLANPHEIAEAFQKLHKSGKVRFFGVSNFRPSLVATLQKFCPMKLIVHQVEISLACINRFEDGTLDQCLAEKMTPMAWSPLARGLLGDGGVSVTPEKAASYGTGKILPVIDAIAAERGTGRLEIALAWLMKHPSGIVPIVGSSNPARIKNAVNAINLELTRDEWYRLFIAARGEALP
jgi:predicted oxidoreductase